MNLMGMSTIEVVEFQEHSCSKLAFKAFMAMAEGQQQDQVVTLQV